MTTVLALDQPALGWPIQEAVALHGAVANRQWPRTQGLAQQMARRAPEVGQPVIADAAARLVEALAQSSPLPAWKTPWTALVAAIDAALDDAEAA